MFTYESLIAMMIGAMAIPALAILVMAMSTMQVAPHHANR